MQTMRYRPGLRPGPRWGAHDAPPDPKRLDLATPLVTTMFEGKVAHLDRSLVELWSKYRLQRPALVSLSELTQRKAVIVHNVFTILFFPEIRPTLVFTPWPLKFYALYIGADFFRVQFPSRTGCFLMLHVRIIFPLKQQNVSKSNENRRQQREQCVNILVLASVIQHHSPTKKNATYRPYFSAMFPETTRGYSYRLLKNTALSAADKLFSVTVSLTYGIIYRTTLCVLIV